MCFGPRFGLVLALVLALGLVLTFGVGVGLVCFGSEFGSLLSSRVFGEGIGLGNGEFVVEYVG
jgi:hypothetical protein